MQPQSPNGTNQNRPVAFTNEALDKKFSFSFTRRQLVVLLNAVAPMQMPVGDAQTCILSNLIDDIRKAAFNAVTDSDFEKETPPATPAVATN